MGQPGLCGTKCMCSNQAQVPLLAADEAEVYRLVSGCVPPGRLRAVSRLTKPHGNVGDKAAAAELANNL